MSGSLDDAWKVFYDALVRKGQTLRHALADYEAATTAAFASYEAATAAAEADVTAAATTFAALLTGQPPVPPPPSGIIPADANLVRIGASTFPLAAVNPTPATHPGGFLQPGWNGRGPDEMVAFQAPVTAPGTNQHGRECTVVAGRAAGPTVVNAGAIAPGAYALSGHRLAAAWLDANVRPGVVVEVLKVDGPPVVPPPPVSAGRTVAVYQMMWEARNGSVASIAAPVNEIRGAFLLGSGLSFPGWAADGQVAFVAAIKAWRAAGRRWVPSIGGGGNPVDISNPAKVVSALKVLADLGIPPDDIDIDVEASGVGVSPVMAMAEAVHSAYGCLIDMTPNGSNVGSYLPISFELQRAGLLRMHAQQFYDSNVPLGTPNTTNRGTAFGRLNEALAAGILPEHLGVAMMLPESGDNAANYWDRATCLANTKAIVAAIPKLGGVAFWERSRAGTLETAADVAAVLGLPAKL